MSDQGAAAFDVIIPTRNRCPYAPSASRFGENPLVWTLESLAADPAAPIRQVIVVDDASSDHTVAVLEKMCELRPQLSLKYVRLDRRRGSAAARNYGARLASAEWLLFTDDDCLFAPRTLQRAAKLLLQIWRDDPQTVALNLPYSLRRCTPARRVRASAIGVFEPGKGRIYGNFDALPWQEQTFVTKNSNEKPGRPMRITNLGCTMLVQRRPFLEVAGFPEDFVWENSYGEETELAARMVDAGHHLYFAAAPDAHVIHLKYGAALACPPPDEGRACDFTILGKRCTLAQLCNWSNRVHPGSGNRVDRAYLAYSRILSYFCIVQARSKVGALLWLCRSCVDFVIAPVAGDDAGLPPLQRAAVWARAVYQGLHWIFRPRISSGISRLNNEPGT